MRTANKPKAGHKTKLDWTRDWLGSYVNDETRLGTLIEHCQCRIDEIVRETAGFTTPNPLRTAVICDIFDKISVALIPNRPLLETIKTELFSAIYEKYPCDFMSGVPYFSKIYELNKRIEDLSAELMESRLFAENQNVRIAELTARAHAAPEAVAEAVATERARYKILELSMLKEKKRGDLAEAEAEGLEQALNDAEKAMEEERSNLRAEEAKFQARMRVAHRIVGSHVPRYELAMSQAEAKSLRILLARQSRESPADVIVTPRPNFFRASEHISLVTDTGCAKPSRLLVDELCERLEFACRRYKRIETRLCRKFVRVHPAQVPACEQ